MSPEEWNDEMDRIWLEPEAVYWMNLLLINGEVEQVLVLERELYVANNEATIRIGTHLKLGMGVPLAQVRSIENSRQQ